MPKKQLDYLRTLTDNLHKKDKEIHQRNELLQLVMGVVVSCAWVWELENNTIVDSCGCGMEKVFGRKITSPNDFKESCHLDDLSRIEAALENTLSSGNSFDECHRILTLGGKEKVLHTIAKLVDERMVGFSIEVAPNSELSKICKSGVLNE